MGWAGMGWDGMRWDAMGWDMGYGIWDWRTTYSAMDYDAVVRHVPVETGFQHAHAQDRARHDTHPRKPQLVGGPDHLVLA